MGFKKNISERIVEIRIPYIPYIKIIHDFTAVPTRLSVRMFDLLIGVANMGCAW
jgi:hypothetical protein